MKPHQQSERTLALAAMAPVIPVLTIASAADAERLGRALIQGGLPVLEVTLRNDAALPAIRAMARLEGGHVGAGTVRTVEDVQRARDAGAAFAVSPGLTDALVAACEDACLPLLPGVATASEAMIAADHGFGFLKLFPAAPLGGVAMLGALAGPLADLAFCPTGGIRAEDAADYLALPNVACVGGSWIAPEAAQRAGDWNGIGARARAAAALTRVWA